MSISSIASLQATRVADLHARFQAHADLKALNGDLQAGNLTAAKTDFATLLQDAPQFQNQLASASNTPEGTALSALSSALQSGNIPTAQTAAASLQAAMFRQDRAHLNLNHPGLAASAAGGPKLQVTL
jgi:hypothetical protein